MKKLDKELGLWDVFAISTGAMISSGFFLLPGLAYLAGGPAVVGAYLIAGVLILPAMLAMAELSTALPRSGGAYFFLDRALGPLTGTVGGLGTWMALVFKTAFALIGGGAYLSLVLDMPMEPVAIGLAVVFLALNIVGAKETALLQRILVAGLVVVLGMLLVASAFAVASTTSLTGQFFPMAPHGWGAVAGTVGLVFVSYMGLTKVASVAEEVKDPGRNIPLGMGLSLAVTTVVYVFGVLALVALLPGEHLAADLTPIASLGAEAFAGLGETLAIGLVVFAALAAFASTANAGIMSASRYLLAMARDRLIPERLGEISRWGTPLRAVVVSTVGILAALLLFDVATVAKLASAFQLVVFGLVCAALIVLRESALPGYAPRFKVPLYPWLPLAGILIAALLIIAMGTMATLFVIGVVSVCVAWFVGYARHRVRRRGGALLFWFNKLGAGRDSALEGELREILKETAGETAFDDALGILRSARVVDARDTTAFRDVVRNVCDRVRDLPGLEETGSLAARFMVETGAGATPVIPGVALPHVRVDNIDHPVLILVRARRGVVVPNLLTGRPEQVHALFFLVSPEDQPERHLKLLAALSTVADSPGFLGAWMTTPGVDALGELVVARLTRARDARLRAEAPSPVVG